MVPESHLSLFRKLCVLGIFFVATNPFVAAQNEVDLHSFQLGTDGGAPYGTLIADSQQNLYGTTYVGGGGPCLFGLLPSGCGTVFELTQSPGRGWSEQVIYSFQGSSDGAFPLTGLLIDQAGNLYGATSAGGTSALCSPTNTPGCGTVFELTPPAQPGGVWTETVLYRFTGGDDGSNPEGSLVLDQAGNLYGTAGSGGVGYGTVYELIAPVLGGSWTELTLHIFNPLKGEDGADPRAGLIFDAMGNLYGTTLAGGVNCPGLLGCGTVFRLIAPQSPSGSWTERVLYAFQGGNDGQGPTGPLLMARGTLLGTTEQGGQFDEGTVFQIRPAGGGVTEAVLYSFQGGQDGAIPNAGLAIDSKLNLYGTTYAGGGLGACTNFPGCGTVFKLSPPVPPNTTWTESVLYAFAGGTDGASPIAGLITGRSWLVGVTVQGGGGKACNVDNGVGCGEIFAVHQ